MPRRVVKYAAGHWRGTIVGFVILLLSLTIGLQFIFNSEEAAERRTQFCEAIPLAAEAGAQAVVDIAAEQAVERGEPEKEIARIRAFGVPIRARAHKLVLDALPTCPQP